MIKTKENMRAIEQKFQQLKTSNKSSKEPKSVAQAIELITSRTVKRNKAHQNPYVPAKIQASVKQTLEKQNQKSNSSKELSQIVNANQNHNQKQSTQQMLVNGQQERFDKQNKQQQQQEYELQQESEVAQQSVNQNEHQIIQNISLQLPDDFQQLPVQQRYKILSKKYGKDKSILEKKFDLIYKHYRKEMYIPYESFQINNQLLMDLRIFLKYYRQFQIAKNFKTNQAITYFKKIALNGLWLDQKNFIEVHYKLIDLLKVNDETIQTQLNNENSTQDNMLKIELSKNIKLFYQNLMKLKNLSGLITDDKIKSILNSNAGNKIINRIVQVHSGLIKEDVLLKLSQRVQDRKTKKNILLGNFNTEKVNTFSPDKKINSSPNKNSQKSSSHKLSIYKQLDLPNLRSREMKQSSIYAFLQLLNTQKEKERLKLLVKDQQKEIYLDAYNRRQRSVYPLPRSNSLRKLPTESISTNNLSIKSVRLQPVEKSDLFQRNLSMPRMKFN